MNTQNHELLARIEKLETLVQAQFEIDNERLNLISDLFVPLFTIMVEKNFISDADFTNLINQVGEINPNNEAELDYLHSLVRANLSKK